MKGTWFFYLLAGGVKGIVDTSSWWGPNFKRHKSICVLTVWRIAAGCDLKITSGLFFCNRSAVISVEYLIGYAHSQQRAACVKCLILRKVPAMRSLNAMEAFFLIDNADNWQLCAYMWLIQCENNGFSIYWPLVRNQYCFVPNVHCYNFGLWGLV